MDVKKIVIYSLSLFPVISFASEGPAGIVFMLGLYVVGGGILGGLIGLLLALFLKGPGNFLNKVLHFSFLGAIGGFMVLLLLIGYVYVNYYFLGYA